jgi:hypothetical protein
VNRRPNLLDVGALAIAVFLAANLIVLMVLLAGRPDPTEQILPRATDPAPAPIIQPYPVVVVTR